MSTLFLTGSTGFLGSHFLINFAGQPFEHAYVLIRGETEQIRRGKLVSALQQAAQSYRVPADIETLMQRVTIIQGDISQPRFGVSDADLRTLQEARIDQFWHYAATLYLEDFRKELIMSTNVGGALHAVEFCQAAQIASFVYISTAYSSGMGNGPVPEALHSLDRRFTNYYEESKCHAEHKVVEICRASGLPLTIFRPTMVIGNSQSKTPAGSDTALYGFIRELRRLKQALQGTTESVRLFGMPEGEVNFIPVDQLMDDIRLVMDNGLGRGDIYHLSSDVNPSTLRAMEMICEGLGIKNLKLTKRGEDPASPIESLIDQKLSLYSNYINAHKLFERKIPRSHVVSEEDFMAYVSEGVKHLPPEDTTNARRAA